MPPSIGVHTPYTFPVANGICAIAANASETPTIATASAVRRAPRIESSRAEPTTRNANDANSASAVHVLAGAIDSAWRSGAPPAKPRSSRESALDASGDSFASCASGSGTIWTAAAIRKTTNAAPMIRSPVRLAAPAQRGRLTPTTPTASAHAASGQYAHG